jgi:hypothetical protein
MVLRASSESLGSINAGSLAVARLGVLPAAGRLSFFDERFGPLPVLPFVEGRFGLREGSDCLGIAKLRWRAGNERRDGETVPDTKGTSVLSLKKLARPVYEAMFQSGRSDFHCLTFEQNNPFLLSYRRHPGSTCSV